ncbi:MAG: hypothetical protein AABM67_07310 [Acidobacteriota bacterium]
MNATHGQFQNDREGGNPVVIPMSAARRFGAQERLCRSTLRKGSAFPANLFKEFEAAPRTAAA